MTLALLLAWLLPSAAGTLAWLALNPARGPGWLAAALGYGIVSGLLLAAAATASFARADTANAWIHAGWWLALFAVIAGIVAWRRAPRPAPVPDNRDKVDKWTNVFLALALASLVWRGGIALREILLRPTFPWDAWDAWAVKSKAWFLLGHYQPFVSMRDWLQHPATADYTGIAWSYPAALGWIQVWFASAVGGWIEPLINLPWFALWLGLLLGHYGQWRALGISRVRALAFVYFLGSLPLVMVHVALAGYADLWVATVFGFGVLAWMRWQQRRERSQLAIAAICALLLPLLKLEGAVWLLLFAGVAAFGMLPRRWRRYVAAGMLAVIVFCIVIGRLSLPLFGLGWVDIGMNAIDVPVIGRLAIAWHGAAFDGVLYSLFSQPNWHLLWWLAPMIVVWRWSELRTQESLRLLGALLLAGFGFLLFLFLFTDAARWAESFTAINRLVMHLTPATMTLLVMLCRDAQWAPATPGTRPASARPPDPA
ncbi:MAG: hypothetical protein P4L92_15275 [Rudaea sp.]|nr:hypothetical protein [Rudaea sp.]